MKAPSAIIHFQKGDIDNLNVNASYKAINLMRFVIEGYPTNTINRNNFLIGIARGEILTRLLIKGHRFREIILSKAAMVRMKYNIIHEFKHTV